MCKILILVLLFPISLLAQNEFRPGYIVTSKGDSVFGLVRYKTSKTATEKCSFRKSKESEVSSFSPSEIDGYGFDNDKVFVSKDIDTTQINTTLVFCELLISGSVNLYRYGEVFLIEKDKLYVLKDETSEVIDKNVTYQHKRKHYAGILYYLFSDCIKSPKRIYAAQLREGTLVSLAREYNSCNGGKPLKEYKKQRARASFDVYAAGGVSNAVIVFDATANAVMSKDETAMKSIAPTVGLGIQVTNPRAFENLYGSVEFYLAKPHFTEEYVKETPTSKSVEEYDFTSSRVKVPIGLKFCFRSTSFTPYVRVGYVFNFFSNMRLTTKRTNSYWNGTEFVANFGNDVDNFKLNHPWGAVGLQKAFRRSKFFLEVRGEGMGGRSNTSIYIKDTNAVIIHPKSMKVNTLNILFGLALKL